MSVPIPKYLVGQRLRAKTAFTNEPGAHPFDPAVVVFKFRDPKGEISIHEAPTRDALGIFEAQVPLRLPGTWWGRSEGRDESGETIAADEYPFEVAPSHF